MTRFLQTLATRFVGAIMVLFSVDVMAGTALAASPTSWMATLVIMVVLEVQMYSNAKTAVENADLVDRIDEELGQRMGE